MITAVSSAGAPKAVGPYSQAVRAGGLLFVAGQIALDLDGRLVDGDITMQARRVLDNIGAVLAAGGLAFSDVVRTTVFLADMNDLAAVNDVYATYVSEPYPARATIQVARLPRDARIEVEAIAAY